MPNNEKTKVLPELSTRAEISAGSYNEAENTIEIIAATETEVSRWDWDNGAYVEVLSVDKKSVRTQRLDNGSVAFIDSHNTYGGVSNIFGKVIAYRFENKQLICTVKLSKRKDIEGIIGDIKDGIISNISVGYSVYKMRLEETRDTGDVYRVTDWEPKEVSTCIVPADYASQTRTEGARSQTVIIENSNLNLNTNMPKENEQTPPTDQNRNEQPPTPAPTATPTPTPAAPNDASRADSANVEHTRSAEILRACTAANLPTTFAQKLIDDKVPLDEARAQIIAEFSKEPVSTDPKRVGVGEDREHEGKREAMTDALILRTGVAPKELAESRERMGRAKEYQAHTLLDIARNCAEMGGANTRGMSKKEIVTRAITSSTSDFAILLDGTARRTLLASYSAVADTWRRFCSTGSVSDFREARRLRMGTLGNLKQVAENEEYKTKPLTDADYEKVFVKKWGDMLNMSYEMIVNDDLGGFTRIAEMQGRAAARTIEAEVYKLLGANAGLGPVMADGNTLFHASHGNIVAVPAAPTVSVFDIMRQQMASQKDKDSNDFLDIMPSLFLGPLSLGGNVRVINGAEYDVDVTKFQVPNRVRGLLKDIIDTPRLTGTAYYMFAAPSEEPVIEVTFLDGQQTPVVERQEAWKTDGVEFKTRLEFMPNAVGWRGALRNAGA